MIKLIKIPTIVLLLAASQILYAQVDKMGAEKKAAAIADSVKNKIAKDTSHSKRLLIPPIKPIFVQSSLAYNAEGYLINKKEINLTDYKSTGDLFYRLPFGFIQSLGSPGMPDETMLYGSGSGAVSYSDDGILLNNRIFNSYDLTNFQSEKIDSIEVYPITKAFLYSPLNENSGINFIAMDRVKEKQYSRLRFLQGKNKEGFIDFLFNMPFSKKFSFTTEITNNNVKDLFLNTEAGGWRASVKLRYNLSEAVNLIGNYSYVNTETKLNGGVNLDSLKQLYPADWESYLYEEKRATVNFDNRGVKTLNHSVSFRMLAALPGLGKTDASVYFQSGLSEFRQNDTVETIVANPYNGMTVIRDDNRYSAYGLLLKHSVLFNGFDFRFILNYEQNKLNTPLLTKEKKNNLFSTALVLTYHMLDSLVHPSIFVKNLAYNSNNYSGFGGDLNITLTKNLFIYAGFSNYKKPYNVFEEEGILKYAQLPIQQITNYETGIRYIKKDFDARAGYFGTTNNNSALPVIIKPAGMREDNVSYLSTVNKTTAGINAYLKYKYSKVLLSVNATSFLSKNEGLVNSPSFTFDGGIYYVDSLFNGNLDLKAGFNFKYYSGQNYFYYDFEKSVSAQYVRTLAGGANKGIVTTPDIFRIDFFLAGRVQDAAIVYMTFENLLDKKYFVVPYYPAMGRNFRFGISWEFLD